MYEVLLYSLLETIYMVSVSCLFAIIFGLPLGIFLSFTKAKGILPLVRLNKVVGSFVNVARSFPFIVLIIVLLPVSRFIVGTSIGSTTAIIPLSCSAIPFIARLFEGALDEVDRGLIEAAKSMGASLFEITLSCVKEALPSLVHGIVITTISLIGYSAMAGALGAGGLGDLAIRIGYQTYNPRVLFLSVLIIIALVQIIQSAGDLIIKIIRKYR